MYRSFVASLPGRTLALGLVAVVVLAFTALPQTEQTARFVIQGPFCSGCIGLLEETAYEIDGVVSIEVSVEERLVLVTFDDARTTAEAIRDHINAETTFKLALQEAEAPGDTSADS